MNKQILLTLLLLLTVVLSASVISASDVNVTDSYTTSLVDDASDVSVPLENTADSSESSVSSDSNVDNDSSKVSLSSEEVLGSENSNTLSTNSNGDDLLNSENGVTPLSSTANVSSSGSNVSSTIDLSKTVQAKSVTKYYKGSTQYTATFYDNYGNVLKNTNVKLTVNGVTYTKKTNANGVASLDVNLKPGTYNVVALNPTTGYKLSTTFKILSTITASDISKVYTDGRKFTATFLKSNGKALANKKIKFKIDGKKYKVKTNANGVASLSLASLSKGTHKIISYNKDGLTKTNTITVVSSTTSSLTTKTYTFLTGDTKKIKVKLLNKFGYAPGKGKIIKITINGKTYSKKTNANGNAKLKLPTLNAGVYTVKYSFEGNSFYKASSASDKVEILPSKTTTFTVKSTTTFGHGANTPFKVALTSGSVPLAKRTVTITLDGKTYTKTTDSNGIVSLPISLAVGKYTITYKNTAESKVSSKTASTAITVKERAATKLTWKSGTSFSQGTQSLKVLLQDANNKALSGKTVKLTVNSKTYSATTSSTGYATFSVNLAAGNQTVSYNFDGTNDNDYTTSSGSTKIEVTKNSNAGGYGYWLFGGDMKNVNLNTLASKGTTDIFLNYYAFTAHGQSAVESWIASANKLGIRVHIWMQTFYDGGSWVNPVKNGATNTAFFNQKIAEAEKYAKVKGVSGIHFDYLRYPGTAYKTSGGTEAINEFVKQVTTAVKKINPDLIVSCALMPETTSNKYYYGQDMATISKYMDVVIPMIYKGNYGKDSSWIKTTTKWFVDNSNGAQVWAGLQSYQSDDNVVKLSLSEITKDSQSALDGSGSGVVLFRWGLSNFVDFNSLTSKVSSSSSSSSSASSSSSSSSSTTETPVSSSSGTISIKNILTGASNLKKYYDEKNALPATVTAGGVTFKLQEFLYVMSQAIYQLGNSNTKDIEYIIGVKAPSSPSGDTIYEDLYKADYLTVAKNTAAFIAKNNQAPNYSSSTVGNIIYSEVVDAFSRILAFYNTYSAMPNYVSINYGSTSSGGSSSSISVTGSGLNELNTITDLSAYLKATTNCQVTNSAIKSLAASLTSGATSDYAKAESIYNYVRDKISYSFYYNTKYGAAGTLSAKTGNCVDQAHLLVALYRAAGLAARYVHGTCKFSSGSTYGHVWTQVLVDGKWIVGDPTSSRNSFGKIVNWNTGSYSLNGKYASLSF